MKSIQRQTLISSILGYLGIAVGFISQGLLVGKYFEVEQNGLISVILAIANPLAILANLGFNGAGNRFFPYFRDEKNGHNGYFNFSILISIIGFIAVSILVILFKSQIINYFSTESPLFSKYFYLLLPITFCLLSFSVFENYSKLLYDSITSTLLQSFLQRFLNLILVILVVIGIINFQEYANFWPLSYFAISVILIFVIIKRKQYFSFKKEFVFPISIKKDFQKFSTISVLTTLSSQVVFQVDKIMLGHHIGLSASGIYTIAFLFGTVIAFPSAALAKSASVFISEAWKSNDLKTIEKIYKNSCIIQFLVGIMIFIGIAANLHNAFQILRPEYRLAENVIYLIGFTKLVDMASGVNGMVISTSKYYIFDTISFMILTVVTVLLNLYLIPKYGVEGAGMAALLTMTIYNLARYYFLYLKFGFQPFNIKFVYVIIIGFFIYYIVNLIPKIEGSIFKICLDVCIRSIFIIISYLSLVYIFKISAETNGFLRNGIKKGISIFK